MAHRDVVALYLAGRDPRVPWYAKALAAATAAYALSPIDLIPDFIPVIGYLDDLVIVPVAIAIIVWLLPDNVMAELRSEAMSRLVANRPRSLAGALVIILLWLGFGVLMAWAILSG
jgi:uncharacterized membrane protein YkvA (DUF1232 family)